MPTVKIEKLVFGGQGLGRVENKVVFIWGALAGEEVEYKVLKSKKNFAEGVVTKVITPAKERVLPEEEHYLCCSPWQTMAYETEQDWKKKIILETYSKISGVELNNVDLFLLPKPFGYRNKMEFSFTLNKEKEVSLALFSRGTHELVSLDGCALASSEINNTAKEIVKWLRGSKANVSSLKSLIVRSNQKGGALAGLFVKDKNFVLPNSQDFKTLLNFQLFYSNPQSPAATPDELLFSRGENFLIERVLDRQFKFGLLSFFQINPPVFKAALEDIKKHVAGKTIDYFSGVGAIGLSVADSSPAVTLIENNPEAVKYAEQNIKLNNIGKADVMGGSAERLLDYISADETIIVDPPRAGLTAKFIARLNVKKPKRIIYLSCELATQARDLGLLSRNYSITFHRFYNFFPRTPHIEGLVVLERNK